MRLRTFVSLYGAYSLQTYRHISGTPRKYALSACSHLDFESVVAAESYENSSLRWSNVKFGHEPHDIACVDTF